ncbi:hypothetical protein BOX15_Mlig007169g2, partial [Macrostomum lignano]
STMAASVPKCPPHQYYYELSKMCDNCPEKCLSGSSTPECERLWSGDFCHPISSSSLPVKMSTSSPSLVTGNSSLITNESISKTGPIVAVAVFSVIALVAIVAAIVALVCRHRHRQRKANEQVDLQTTDGDRAEEAESLNPNGHAPTGQPTTSSQQQTKYPEVQPPQPDPMKVTGVTKTNPPTSLEIDSQPQDSTASTIGNSQI